MIIISDREEKLSHQDFIERMYTSIDTEFALVSFAAYKVIEEYKKTIAIPNLEVLKNLRVEKQQKNVEDHLKKSLFVN